MSKNDFLLLSSLFLLSVSLFLATLAWQGPTGNPPGSNLAPPIYTDTSPQTKPGALRLGGLRVDSHTWLATEGENVGIGTTDPKTTVHVVYSSNSLQRGIISNNFSDSRVGGKVFVLKGRGTTTNPQPVLAGDQLGVFAFGGYFGTGASDFLDQAAILADATENWTPTRRGSRLRFTTTPNGSIDPQIRMVIDQDGNVGIGTLTPTARLEIYQSAGATQTNVIKFGDAAGKGYLTAGSSYVGIGTNDGNTRLAIVNSGSNIGNVGIGTTVPGYKLEVAGTMKGELIASNRNPVGLEFNILFNATNRYIVSQSGSTSFYLPSLFDGVLRPSYTPDGVNPANPIVILIENLPSAHTQAGAWVGWTTRYWPPRRFKIEGYDIYAGYNNWRTMADYSTTNYYGSDFMTKIPVGGQYTKLRFTIYEGTGSVGANGYARVGLSEIFFIHPEANRLYSGLLPSSMWEVAGNVGIGTTSPGAKLHVASGLIETGTRGVRQNLSFVDSCGTTRLTRVHNGIWAPDYSGGCGDEWFIGVQDRDGGEASTLVIGMWNDANDHIALIGSGNVGIGTTSPVYKLEVVGSVGANAYYYRSDVRFKDNIEKANFDNILEKISQIGAIKYTLDGERQIGLSAQEVEKVFPEIIIERNGEKSIDLKGLVTVLLEAIKKQNEKIKFLEEKIEILTKGQ